MKDPSLERTFTTAEKKKGFRSASAIGGKTGPSQGVARRKDGGRRETEPRRVTFLELGGKQK